MAPHLDALFAAQKAAKTVVVEGFEGLRCGIELSPHPSFAPRPAAPKHYSIHVAERPFTALAGLARDDRGGSPVAD